MYKWLYKFILCKVDAELMHSIGLFFLKYLNILLFVKKPVQHTDFFGRKILNPVGIAAGFDKNGECIKGLYKLGAGFVEIGTVTPFPQKGNPKPRLFRIENGLINFLGFPGKGSKAVLENLKNFNQVKGPNQVIGVNIGKNREGKEEDYLLLIEKFIANADYIVINISSPNTPGLTDMLKEENLQRFLLQIKKKREDLPMQKPFFLKISPDVTTESLKYIYRLIIENKIEGIIISNTTIERPPNFKYNNIKGGLSGEFLQAKSLLLLKEFNKLNKERKVCVISCGGILTKEEAKARLTNGANFLQVYTGIILNGPSFISTLL